MQEGQPSIVYTLDTNLKEYGSSYLYLHVFQAECHFVQHAIDGAIDNKAGYGDVRTAQKMEAWYRGLLAAGFTHYYNTGYGSSTKPGFRIRWLYYTGDRSSGYCQHRFEELGDSHLDSFGPSMELLSKVFKAAKKMFPGYSRDSNIIDTPSVFLQAVDQIGTRVIRFDKNWEEPLTYVEDRSPRPRLRDDDIVSMFDGRSRSLYF